VGRGGGWNDSAEYARSAFRDFDDPYDRDYSLGFRLARP
jgi:formylglycine-generating enzyme required for sulfatase activity